MSAYFCEISRDFRKALQGKLLFCIVRICYPCERSCATDILVARTIARNHSSDLAKPFATLTNLTVLVNMVHIRDLSLYDSVKYL